MGLIARALETAGIATMSMSVMLDITRSVKPPRATFLDFPPGHTTGRPFDRLGQEAIVRDALAGLETMTESGAVQILPYRWSDDERWKQTPLPDRLPRLDTPQFQCDQDRVAALGHDATCPVCVINAPDTTTQHA